MAEENFGRRIPFAFLEDTKGKFETIHGGAAKFAIAYGLNEFSKVLEKQMEYYSNDSNSDKIKYVQSEVDSVKKVMIDNIGKTEL
jgi:vesicle-associated membrane protein 7